MIKVPEKIKIAAFCDENMGRSAFFEWNTRMLLDETPELKDRVKVISAGTKVAEKGSILKYGGKTSPEVIAVARLISPRLGELATQHRVQAYRDDMITPFTIAAVFNDPNGLSPNVVSGSLLCLDFRRSDPSEQNSIVQDWSNQEMKVARLIGGDAFQNALLITDTYAYHDAFQLIEKLTDAIENDDLEGLKNNFRKQLLGSPV